MRWTLAVGLTGTLVLFAVLPTPGWADGASAGAPPVGLMGRYPAPSHRPPSPPPPPSPVPGTVWTTPCDPTTRSWTTMSATPRYAPAPRYVPAPRYAPAAGYVPAPAVAEPPSAATAWIRQKPKKRPSHCVDWWSCKTREYWYEYYFCPRSTGDWLSLSATGAFVAGGAALFIGGDEELIEEVGDYTQLATPVAAFAVPVLKGDWWGAVQFGASFITAVGSVQIAKALIEEWRPNLSNPDSYPSGHTTAAFSGAAFLYSRYGPYWGIPAYALALYTGFSRVYASKHYLDDVIAGAGLAMISNWLWAMPFGQECDCRIGRSMPRRWRIEFTYGYTWQGENVVQVSRDTGTRFDFVDWENGTSGLPTSRFRLQCFPARHHEITLSIDPLEFRYRETLSTPLSFDGVSFASGTEVLARWLGHEYKLRYRYDFFPEGRFGLQAGASLILGDYAVEMTDGARSPSQGETGVMAVPHLGASYDIVRDRLTVWAHAEGLPGVDFAALDFEGGLRYQFECQWDLGLGYRWSGVRVDVPEVFNEATVHEVYLAIGRSF